MKAIGDANRITHTPLLTKAIELVSALQHQSYMKCVYNEITFLLQKRE